MSSVPPDPVPMPAPGDIQDTAPYRPVTTIDVTATAPLPIVRGQPAPMISVDHVTKIIGGNKIVDDLTFEVRAGEIFGFIGPSGSGKTSTIRLLTGVYGPSEGEVKVMGVPPDHPSRRMQEQFGYMPQLFVLYPNLTVYENLGFVAALYGMRPLKRRRRIKELLKFVELSEARDRVAANVSGGMLRRLQLAAALLNNPPLLFADEPTAGIDPVLRGKFWDEFRRLRDEGRTIFVTTQYVGESEYCDRVGVLRKGRLIAVDTPLALRRAALGGDIVDVMTTGLRASTVQKLAELDIVKDLRQTSRREMRVYVEEAGKAIPVLLDALSSEQATVSRIEEYKPTFDEIFIELMNKDAAARGEEGVDGEVV